MVAGTNRAKGGSIRPGAPVDPFRLRRAMWARRYFLLASWLGGLALGFLIAKLGMSSAYESTALLKFEGNSSVSRVLGARDALAPSAEALHHQAVLKEIAERIEFKGPLSALEAQLPYDLDLKSETMSFTVSGKTSEEAASRARVVTETMFAYLSEGHAKRAELELQRIRSRIVAAEDAAEDSRRKYDEFREANGIADLSSDQRRMLESAAGLRADSEIAASEIRALEAEVASLEEQLATTPQTRVLTGNSPERLALEDLRRQLATSRASLSDNHPQVQSLEQQVRQLQSQVRRGATSSSTGGGLVAANTTHQNITDELRSAKSNLLALQERQRSLTELAATAQVRVENFSDIEGEATSLLADVEVNDALAQDLRKTEAAIEDALQNPSSGFTVLDAGSLPEYPVRNKLKLVVFGLIPLLTLGLALGFVLRREFDGLRVQTPNEIAYWGGGPVLGTTSWPMDSEGLEELVAGLDDYAPDARGLVLIVGGSNDERPLALELAERMNEDWTMAQQSSTSASPSDRPFVVTPQPIHEAPPAPTRSGPYPTSRPPSGSTALATRPSIPPLALRTQTSRERVTLEAWDGPLEGQALRRAARLADRVLVLIRCGGPSAIELKSMKSRLGRDDGVGYIVLGLAPHLRGLPDRAGDVSEFWLVKA